MPIRDNVTQALSVIDPRRPENLRRNDSSNRAFVWRGSRRRRVPSVEFSLGWELEANKEAARYPNGVEKISDGSVNGDSAEYIVMPSVTKSPRFVLGLLKDLVHAPELNTDKSCGFHVHMAPKIDNLTKMRLWAITCQELARRIEDAAFNAVPDARQNNNYCRRVEVLQHGTRFASSKYSNDRRYQWLNVVEMFRPSGIRTVEVRLLGNTHRWKYLLSWVAFSLWLGKQAWKVQHGGLTMDQAALELSSFLKKITEEIKPLDKRGEPIPQWVYDALHKLGIDSTAWDRPLQKLYATECEVTGRRKVFYSDAQATVENDTSDDEDSCVCGCGADGRCDTQLHDDGDCDADYCSACHSEGNCTARYCEACREAAHNDGDLCEWGTNCVQCTRERARQLTLTLTEDEAQEEAIRENNGRHIVCVPYDESVIVASAIDNPANYAPAPSGTIANAPELTATEASGVFYGQSIVDMIGTYTGHIHASNIAPLTAGEVLRGSRYIPDGVVIPISEDEMIQSRDREAFYNNGGAR